MELRSLLRQRWGNLQFFISVVIGWYVCSEMTILNTVVQTSVEIRSLSQKCSPCSEMVCQTCESNENIVRRIRNVDVENSYFRKYPYTPKSMSEDIVQRWRVVTSHHMFENINAEPRVGLNGMWRLEKENVEKNLKGVFGKQTAFESMHRRTDPFTGTNYFAKLQSSSSEGRKNTVVQMQRGFSGSKPKLLEITSTRKKKLLTIIAPLSRVSDRFHFFLKRFEETVLRNAKGGTGYVKLLFVIFETTDDDKSATDLLNVLDEFRTKNPNALVQHVLTVGKFSRALGLHIGVEKCKPWDLMLFLDVDMFITEDFFDRIRRNTIQNKTVYFPVTFSQYDPMIIGDASQISAISNEICPEKSNIDQSTGYWIHYAFGIAAMYKSDYVKVGGFKLDIEGWGGEDVDLYKKFISEPSIEVFAAVDHDLIHVYHGRGCDPKLPGDQYRMCVGAWAETLGSQIEVAGLYLQNANSN